MPATIIPFPNSKPDFCGWMNREVGCGWRVVKVRRRDKFDIACEQAGLPAGGRKLLQREYRELAARYERLYGPRYQIGA